MHGITQATYFWYDEFDNDKFENDKFESDKFILCE